jgi:hypothetical protein
VSHLEDKQPTSMIHAESESLVTSGHTRQMSPTSVILVGEKHLDTASHPRRNPLATASHARGIDIVEKPRHIGCEPKFPCNICKGDHLTHLYHGMKSVVLV